MPTISIFFGISIRMFYDDHAPPHFHAFYGSHAAVVDIATLVVREGTLPRRARSLILEWASLHREELMEDWILAERHARLKQIAPLE